MLCCDQCENQTYSAKHLFDHMEARHLNNEYNCEKCDFVAKTRRQIKYCEQNVHQELRFYCDACDFNTTRSDNLRSHEQAVQNKQKYIVISALKMMSNKAWFCCILKENTIKTRMES